VFGPPRDPATALAVLREAVASGVCHLDTSDYYRPHFVIRLIREALHSYPHDLVIVTKVGARRGPEGSWRPAFCREGLVQAVHDNLRHLALDILDVVNLRAMFDPHGPAEGSLEEPLATLAELQQQGLIRHVGLSNVTRTQITRGRKICEIACLQNHYNLAHRTDDALIDELAAEGIAYVPYFPLGGFSPLQSSTLSRVAQRLGAAPLQIALAWLLQRAPNVLLIPGTSSLEHLRENLAAGALKLPGDAERHRSRAPTVSSRCGTCRRSGRGVPRHVLLRESAEPQPASGPGPGACAPSRASVDVGMRSADWAVTPRRNTLNGPLNGLVGNEAWTYARPV
jgi:aryl-alcohol dehydrogenase-like predicted oxidoreductase